MLFLLNISNVLFFFSGILTIFTLWLIFFWVPTEINEGNAQRILYVHVPVAWVSMLAIIMVAFTSVAYLRTGKKIWDRLGLALAEVGALFAGLMLLTGMIWARPIWGVWWTGEAKLIFALILFFIYVGYLMFRAYFPAGEQRRRLSAIIGLIGAIDTPIIYYAANLWSQAHPPTVIGPAADSDSAFAGEFGITLIVAMISFTVLFICIVKERFSIKILEDDLIEFRDQIDVEDGILT